MAARFAIGRGQQQWHIGRGQSKLLLDAHAVQTPRRSLQNLECHAG